MSSAPESPPSLPATDLTDVVASFVKAFDTWVRRRALEAGASAPRLRLLYELHCEGPRRMADLADVLGVTPRSVTALVDGLEHEGLVRRAPHATDRRVTMIELTAEPERMGGQFEAYRASVAKVFENLSDDDRAVLERVLPVLEATMREPGGDQR